MPRRTDCKRSDQQMVTKSVEKAQNTVESRNAEIRKNVLKYDDVLSRQRSVIYADNSGLRGVQT